MPRMRQRQEDLSYTGEGKRKYTKFKPTTRIKLWDMVVNQQKNTGSAAKFLKINLSTAKQMIKAVQEQIEGKRLGRRGRKIKKEFKQKKEQNLVKQEPEIKNEPQVKIQTKQSILKVECQPYYCGIWLFYPYCFLPNNTEQNQKNV